MKISLFDVFKQLLTLHKLTPTSDATSLLSFVFHSDWSQIIAAVKSMTPNFAVVVNVLLPICCHIGTGMPYLLIFGERIVAISGAITDKWAIKLFCGRNLKTSNDQVKFAAKIFYCF